MFCDIIEIEGYPIGLGEVLPVKAAAEPLYPVNTQCRLEIRCDLPNTTQDYLRILARQIEQQLRDTGVFSEENVSWGTLNRPNDVVFSIRFRLKEAMFKAIIIANVIGAMGQISAIGRIEVLSFIQNSVPGSIYKPGTVAPRRDEYQDPNANNDKTFLDDLMKLLGLTEYVDKAAKALGISSSTLYLVGIAFGVWFVAKKL